MNEILKKRIEKVPYKKIHPYNMEVNDAYNKGFEDGAEYALSHQWISVDESLPEPEEEVIIFNESSIRHYEVGWLRKKGYSKSKWAITNGFVEDEDITHWMPIPKFETNVSI